MNDDKIKELLAYGFAVESFVRQIKQGIGITHLPGEIVALWKLISTSAVVIADAPLALDQYLTLSEADAADINAFVEQNYGATPDNVDKLIEGVLQFIVSLHNTAALVTSLLHKPATEV